MIKTSKFSQYQHENPPVQNAMFLKDEEGNDWYEMQKKFKENTFKVEYDEDGNIWRWSRDAHDLFPNNLYVAEVKSLPDDMQHGAFKFDGKRVVKRKITAEETRAKTEKIINKILQTYGARVSSLSALVSAGVADEATKNKLNVYTDYLKKVVEVDKLKPEWPEEPQL